MTTTHDEALFTRFYRWVGNLDHPFYEEERQRHVWYEASAIGFQAMLVGVLAISAGTVWIGGQEAIKYTVGFLAVTLLNVAVFQRYVHTHRAVLHPSAADVTRPRTLIPIALATIYFAGVANALDWGWIAVAGFAATLTAVIVVTVIFSHPRDIDEG